MTHDSCTCCGPDPDRFLRGEPWPVGQFGSGRRVCVGKYFSRGQRLDCCRPTNSLTSCPGRSLAGLSRACRWRGEVDFQRRSNRVRAWIIHTCSGRSRKLINKRGHDTWKKEYQSLSQMIPICASLDVHLTYALLYVDDAYEQTSRCYLRPSTLHIRMVGL